MRGHRRSSRLIAVVIIAVAVGASALLAPWIHDAPVPTAGDLAAGWALLTAACAVSTRRPGLGAVLLVAGASWIANGAAPFLPAGVSDVVARTSLLPTALLVIAAAMCASTVVSRRRVLVTVVAALAVASVGALLSARLVMVAFGASALQLVAERRPQQSRADAASRRALQPACWIGTALLVIGVCTELGIGGVALITNLHQLVIVVGAAMVAWQTIDVVPRPGSDPVTDALVAALGDALDAELEAVAFPRHATASVDSGAEADGWFDPMGRPTERTVGGGAVFDGDRVLAWLSPPLAAADVSDEVRRVLSIAGEVARLRADLRLRADDIARSTERLATAADRERARLAAVLDAGPLVLLAKVGALVDGGDVDSGGVDPELGLRLTAAQDALRDVVRGIEPADLGAGIELAVRALARRFGATCAVDVREPVDAASARLVWFTCAEALANTAKYAVGAPVHVALQADCSGFHLDVVDGGRGGADPAGGGLVGLRQRAAQFGALLTVESPVGGGTHVSLASSSTTRYPRDQLVTAPMSAGAAEETMAT